MVDEQRLTPSTSPRVHQQFRRLRTIQHVIQIRWSALASGRRDEANAAELRRGCRPGPGSCCRRLASDASRRHAQDDVLGPPPRVHSAVACEIRSCPPRTRRLRRAIFTTANFIEPSLFLGYIVLALAANRCLFLESRLCNYARHGNCGGGLPADCGVGMIQSALSAYGRAGRQSSPGERYAQGEMSQAWCPQAVIPSRPW